MDFLIDKRRLAAVLSLRDLNVSRFARRCGVSPDVLYRTLRGDRTVDDHLMEALKKELGDETWKYVVGQRETIPEML